jgi:phosphoglycerol transferase MdoB-like AlkP superfamily enzyme
MNLLRNLFKHKRYSLLYFYTLFYLLFSEIIRLVFYFWSLQDLDFSIINLFRILLTGLFFDLGTISYFLIPYTLYLFILPNKLIGSIIDKSITYFAYSLGLIIFTFSFLAEFTFWEEFKTRFNFIAVDYLVYTYEVVENINQSYPMPILISGILLIVGVFIFITARLKIFNAAFSNTTPFKQRIPITILVLSTAILFTSFVNNKNAEWSINRYENELSKSGIYSFFAAFRNNELSYPDFYITQDIDKSFNTIKKLTLAKNETFLPENKLGLKRQVKNTGEELKPNIVFICIESFSSSYMKRFGNNEGITPYLDSLAQHSIFFTNLYATGTRTVRGMEAITLSVPPSPGRSIVKRTENSGLFNIGTIFKQKDYKNVFFYGGDGYFDNMNQFFGGNGFDIVDRGRGYLMGDEFTSKRTNIEDNEVQFENAWGVCDEDIYNKVLKEADLNHEKNQPFFNFIMTTSNHRPFTYPEGRIDIPSKTGRGGAVKYTDYAINDFIKKAQQKPWFKNTVFVIMSDHCASSAGRQELDASKYHIPALIYNLPNNTAYEVNKMCSQIDLFPTVFGYLNWSYYTQLFGRDVNLMEAKDERAFVGNYRKMGYLKGDNLTVLGDQKVANFYIWNRLTNDLNLTDENKTLIEEAISFYQGQDYLYQNGLLKLDK